MSLWKPAQPVPLALPKLVPPAYVPVPEPLSEPTAEPEELTLPTQDNLWDAYLWVESRLVALGWHATSPFWLGVVRKFLTSGKKRLVVQVGRRGGKSVTICRIVATIVLFGKYDIPQGDVGYFPILSVKLKDAKKKLAILAKIFRALEVEFKPTKEELFLSNYPVIVESRVASANTVVGDTCIGLMLEEVSRWRDKESNANPARNVISSIRPNMATQPNALEFMISSPWSTDDAHYDAVKEGDTDLQMVVEGVPSWEANPVVSEKWCRDQEPIELFFNREYACIPMSAGTETFYPASLIDDAMLPWEPPVESIPSVGAMDLAFDSDWFAWGTAKIKDEEYWVTFLEDRAPLASGNTKFSEVVDQCVPTFRSAGVVGVMTDRHYKRAVEERMNTYGIFLIYAPDDPATTHIRLKTLLQEGKVHLPKSKRLRSHLLSVMSSPGSGGKIKIILPRRTKDGHCDDVAALVLLTYQTYAAGADDAPEPAEPPRRPAVQAEIDRREQGKANNWLDVNYSEGRDTWANR